MLIAAVIPLNVVLFLVLWILHACTYTCTGLIVLTVYCMGCYNCIWHINTPCTYVRRLIVVIVYSMGCYDCVWHINLYLHNAYPAWAIPSCMAIVLVLPRITSLSQRGVRRSWPSTSWTMARLAWMSEAGVVNLACAVPSWRLVNKLFLYCTAQGFIAWG